MYKLFYLLFFIFISYS